MVQDLIQEKRAEDHNSRLGTAPVVGGSGNLGCQPRMSEGESWREECGKPVLGKGC